MTHLTRTKVTQIKVRLENGEDPVEVAELFGCTVERVYAVTGTKPKKVKPAASETEPETASETASETSAADEFK